MNDSSNRYEIESFRTAYKNTQRKIVIFSDSQYILYEML